MQAELQAHIAFHLTGRMPRGSFDAHAQGGLRPAVFAGYRDLTALRYDFPLVLMRAAGDRQSVQSLSGLIDGALRAVAANGDGERGEAAWPPARAGNPQTGRRRRGRAAVQAVG